MDEARQKLIEKRVAGHLAKIIIAYPELVWGKEKLKHVIVLVVIAFIILTTGCTNNKPPESNQAEVSPTSFDVSQPSPSQTIIAGSLPSSSPTTSVSYSSTTSATPMPTEEQTIDPNAVITFADPVIESETRKILNRPSGNISEGDVSGIECFGGDGNGQFGDISGNITTLTDLRWFVNLKMLVLSGCNISNLNGIEDLSNLQTLYVRRNNISSIEPVRNLVNLISFDCSGNRIRDYSALSGLVNLQNLWIGDSGIGPTDLSPLKNLTDLKSLYAPWCGISDISVLSDKYDLMYLQLFHNNISYISVLKGLTKLNYLSLNMNDITDISVLDGLTNLTYIGLQDNPVPDNELQEYYEPKDSDYSVSTFYGKLNDNMPEFKFDIRAYFNKEMNGHSVQTITVTDTSTGKAVQTISIPELTIFGQTDISVYDKDTMGFQLEDMNFDGYKDIRLFDTQNGNYRQEWIYLIWNSEKNIFVDDKRLNDISMANFDQENKLIYGMERGSAVDHYYSTSKYIDGTPTLIATYSEEGLFLNDDQIKKYLDLASVKTDVTDFMAFHEMNTELDEKTGSMITTSDEIVVYANSDMLSDSDVITKFDASSEIGLAILNENSNK